MNYIICLFLFGSSLNAQTLLHYIVHNIVQYFKNVFVVTDSTVREISALGNNLTVVFEYLMSSVSILLQNIFCNHKKDILDFEALLSLNFQK